jgi:hypothetical protein
MLIETLKAFPEEWPFRPFRFVLLFFDGNV